MASPFLPSVGVLHLCHLCCQGPCGVGSQLSVPCCCWGHFLPILLPPCLLFPAVRSLAVHGAFPFQACLFPLGTFRDITPNIPLISLTSLSVCFPEELTDTHTYIIRVQDMVDIIVRAFTTVIIISHDYEKPAAHLVKGTQSDKYTGY